MWLQEASLHLGWPSVDEVTTPSGGGPSHYAQSVQQKVGKALSRKFGLPHIQTGILCANSHADTAEAPLAVVIQFSASVSDAVLRETQRLCWNFSKAALLVTLEPTRIQAWSCALAPKVNRKLDRLRVIEPIETANGSMASVLQSEAAQALHWVNLISGAFLQQHESKFKKNERADALLVSNLRTVRTKLIERNLSRDIAHALLARLIFTQFLFQRTDSNGQPAISQSILDGRFDGYLTNRYQQDVALERILENKEETYALFRWLNEKFNGDLFPGKGETPEEREVEWQDEKNKVDENKHLKLLSAFVAGNIELKSGQGALWPLYSFDILPLEFISSVYEEFLNEDRQTLSAYYTRPHLVDFVLDGVLPWGGTDWNLKVLDPCCGSGIFLVKAFQRLVQRWKNANPGSEPGVDDLRGLLENNLFGVDDHEDAIRVASFSLCLALCDAIDPRHYWKRCLFPPLRDVRLIKSDFFSEEYDQFKTLEEDADNGRKWDLVIGNAPWRDSSLDEKSLATTWATKHGWPVADKNAGPLFLAKGAAITRRTGRVSLIQPAATILYQRSSKASDQLRRKLFSATRVEEVVSFAHLRWQLFKGVKSPACLVTLRPIESETDYALTYICPKPLDTTEDKSVIAIERQDTHEIMSGEAIYNPLIWTVLLLGQRRDAELIDRLNDATTLRKLKAETKELAREGQVLLTREGIIRGKSAQREEPGIVGRRILEKPNFPFPDAFTLRADNLPVNTNPRVHSRDSTDFGAFDLPQLLIKKSILKDIGRFQARVVDAQGEVEGVICTHSYVSVHQFAGEEDWLSAVCLALHSSVSAYFLALTSRLAYDRGEALSDHLLDVPIPHPHSVPDLHTMELENVDTMAEDAFHLKEPECALISDLLRFGYREGASASSEKPSRAHTVRSVEVGADDLSLYADFFIKTLRATFGNDRAVRATVFEESAGHARLPMRMIAIHLNWPTRRRLIAKDILGTDQLRSELARFYVQQINALTRDGQAISSGLGFRRVARIFLTHLANDGTKVPTVFYIKPDQRRYWTRSQGLRDADELAAAIVADRRRRKAAK